MSGKTLGDMGPAERAAVIRRAADSMQAELQANAGAIGAIMDAAEAGGTYSVDIHKPDGSVATHADFPAAERGRMHAWVTRWIARSERTATITDPDGNVSVRPKPTVKD